MGTNDLKAAYEAVCDAYLKAFCDKHGYEPGTAEWVDDVVVLGDDYVDFETIRTDIDLDIPTVELRRYLYCCNLMEKASDGDCTPPTFRKWLDL